MILKKQTQNGWRLVLLAPWRPQFNCEIQARSSSGKTEGGLKDKGSRSIWLVSFWPSPAPPVQPDIIIVLLRSLGEEKKIQESASHASEVTVIRARI
jgi:hypothetical protein